MIFWFICLSIMTEAAPQAQEKLSYGMPYYTHKGHLA